VAGVDVCFDIARRDLARAPSSACPRRRDTLADKSANYRMRRERTFNGITGAVPTRIDHSCSAIKTAIPKLVGHATPGLGSIR
jgi:hypothetical protein